MSDEVNAGHLRAFIERIERLEEEKAERAADIREVYGEAKANGFNVKIMRKVVGLRKQDRDKRLEEETILDCYLSALGMLADTPLGEAAYATEKIRLHKRGLGRKLDEGGATETRGRAPFSPLAGEGGASAPDEGDTPRGAAGKGGPSPRPSPVNGKGGAKLEAAVTRFRNAMGKSVELTDEERAKGVQAAFVNKDGNRVSIAFGERLPRRSEAAI